MTKPPKQIMWCGIPYVPASDLDEAVRLLRELWDWVKRDGICPPEAQCPSCDDNRFWFEKIEAFLAAHKREEK